MNSFQLLETERFDCYMNTYVTSNSYRFLIIFLVIRFILLQILRSIRQGLGEMERGPDDTYMYCDEEAHEMGRLSHWYDEPPYESDPEDFLMGEQLHPR